MDRNKINKVHNAYLCFIEFKVGNWSEKKNSLLTDIILYFREEGELWKEVWGTSLLPQVVIIFSIKPISNIISLDKENFIQL